jgi:hypothetical protein
MRACVWAHMVHSNGLKSIVTKCFDPTDLDAE